MRKDGRAKNSLRKVIITKDFLKFAESSCLIEIGNTKVICTASVEKTVPLFLKNTSCGWITAEYGMLPGSGFVRIPREVTKEKVKGRIFEIQRLIGRSMRAVVDLKALGERTIYLDCDVIQADGGTRTTSITGAFVALFLCLKKLKKKEIIPSFPIKNFVAATSVGIVNSEVLLDLSYEEDKIASVDMNVIMTENKKIVEIQGTAEQEPFSKELMENLFNLAEIGIMELIQKQKEVVLEE